MILQAKQRDIECRRNFGVIHTKGIGIITAAKPGLRKSDPLQQFGKLLHLRHVPTRLIEWHPVGVKRVRATQTRLIIGGLAPAVGLRGVKWRSLTAAVHSRIRGVRIKWDTIGNSRRRCSRRINIVWNRRTGRIGRCGVRLGRGIGSRRTPGARRHRVGLRHLCRQLHARRLCQQDWRH